MLSHCLEGFKAQDAGLATQYPPCRNNQFIKDHTVQIGAGFVLDAEIQFIIARPSGINDIN